LLDPQPVKGLRLLAFWENGFRHVTNNVRPIAKPEDLRGIKLRIPRGVWRQRMFEAYGANPTPMAFAEVFSALQTGVMDGQENPLAQICSAKLHEVQKYLSMTGHVYTPAYPTAGERRWHTLPPDVRIVVRRIAENMGVWFRYVVQRALPWYDEFAEFLLVWLTFYGSALAAHRGAHIGFETLTDSLPPAARRAAAIFAEGVVLFVLIALWRYGWTLAQAASFDTA